MLCDHLEGWDRDGGRETQEGGDMGIYVYVELIHFVIKQKLTHHCKAIILQCSNKDVKKKKIRSQTLVSIYYVPRMMWVLNNKEVFPRKM